MTWSVGFSVIVADNIVDGNHQPDMIRRQAVNVVDSADGHVVAFALSADDASRVAATPDLIDAVRAILFQVAQGKIFERDACIAQARAAYVKAIGSTS